jgi:hypothetical protein
MATLWTGGAELVFSPCLILICSLGSPLLLRMFCNLLCTLPPQDLLLFASQEVLGVLGADDAAAGTARERVAATASAAAAAAAAAATAAAATAAAQDPSRLGLATPRRAGELMCQTQVVTHRFSSAHT